MEYAEHVYEETKQIQLPDGFSMLWDVLEEAFRQAYEGKGRQRHGGNGLDFTDQPIFTIARDHGIGFLTGQAAKKLAESHVLRELGSERAENELLGAIVYTAAAIMALRNLQDDV